MIKIGISGKARTGKDTVARYIREIINNYDDDKYNLYLSFADPIKSIIMAMFPDNTGDGMANLFGTSKLRSKPVPGLLRNNKPITYRMLCQEIGTDLKKYKKSIWIDALNTRLIGYLGKPINDFNNSYDGNLVVVPDLRFQDEFDYLKSNGFKLIRLKRNFHMKSNHISETEQEIIKDEEFDAIIENNGSKKDLKIKVINIINSLNGY